MGVAVALAVAGAAVLGAAEVGGAVLGAVALLLGVGAELVGAVELGDGDDGAADAGASQATTAAGCAFVMLADEAIAQPLRATMAVLAPTAVAMRRRARGGVGGMAISKSERRC